MLDVAWNGLRSNWMVRQLDVSYNRFHRNPLYRRWSLEAYNNPMAHRAEIVPEKVSEILTIIMLGLPVAVPLVQVFFGTDVLKMMAVVMAGLFFALALFLPASVLAMSALLAALPLAQERAAGRWELLMVIPSERYRVLVMRISSILYPYRPVIMTLDMLQTFLAFLTVVTVSILTGGDDNLVSACIVFFVPAMILLTWERRQDHILCLAVGAFAGLHFNERLVLSRTLMLVGVVLAVRWMAVLAAFGIVGYAIRIESVTPALVGGAAMLPISGLNFFPALAFALLYYALREGMIYMVWKSIVVRMRNV